MVALDIQKGDRDWQSALMMRSSYVGVLRLILYTQFIVLKQLPYNIKDTILTYRQTWRVYRLQAHRCGYCFSRCGFSRL